MSDAFAGRPAVGAVILDVVEYFSPGMSSGPRIEERYQIYRGAGPRKPDAMHCLSIMSPCGERRHNIEVGSIVGITVGDAGIERREPIERVDQSLMFKPTEPSLKPTMPIWQMPPTREQAVHGDDDEVGCCDIRPER